MNDIPTWNTHVPLDTTHLWEGNPYKKVGSRMFRWCNGWVLSSIESEVLRSNHFICIKDLKVGRQIPNRFKD